MISLFPVACQSAQAVLLRTPGCQGRAPLTAVMHIRLAVLGCLWNELGHLGLIYSHYPKDGKLGLSAARVPCNVKCVES